MRTPERTLVRVTDLPMRMVKLLLASSTGYVPMAALLPFRFRRLAFSKMAEKQERNPSLYIVKRFSNHVLLGAFHNFNLCTRGRKLASIPLGNTRNWARQI